jgi:hypothetical protein
VIERGEEKWPGEYPDTMEAATENMQIRSGIAPGVVPTLGPKNAFFDFRCVIRVAFGRTHVCCARTHEADLLFVLRDLRPHPRLLRPHPHPRLLVLIRVQLPR